VGQLDQSDLHHRAGRVRRLWTKLGSRQPATPVKFGVAAIVMGAAFLLFLPFAGGGENSTPLLAIIGILFVFTVAELLLSPVGLSVTTKLAPEAFHTQMVALLPVGRARHRDRRAARDALRPRRRGALLLRAGPHRDRCRRAAAVRASPC
jgi:hypothetical protein